MSEETPSTQSMTIDDALALAVGHHQAGELAEAESIYRQILQAMPQHPDALHLLGVVARQMGNNDAAIELISKAIQAKPDFTEAYSNLGNALKDLGRVSDAILSYRKAIELKPDLAEAHFNLGSALQQQGKLHEAVSSFETAIGLKPDYPSALNNLGNALASLKQFERAKDCFAKALDCAPEYAEAHNNLGQLYLAMNRPERAVGSFKQAVSLNPDYAEAQCNAGVAFDRLGRFDEAIDAYKQALRVRPAFAFALNNLANTYRTLGKLDEASIFYRKALEYEPSAAKLHSNLGAVLIDQGKAEEALTSYRKAVELEPDYFEAYVNIASALAAQGAIEDAIAHMDKALESEPDNAGWLVRRALYLPVIAASSSEFETYRARLRAEVAKIRARNLRIEDPYRENGSANFRASYDNVNNKELMQEIAELHLALCPSLAETAPHCTANAEAIKRPAGKRLKIGFVSAYLRRHTIGKLNAGIIAQFSRQDFEVVVVRAPGGRDEMSREIDQSADSVVQLVGQLPVDRKKISDEAFDILFYLDIGMSPYTYFLSFARLAPVQAVTWGHPDTTGVANVDYFISSHLMEPEGADQHYCEQLVQLDYLPTYYMPPEPVDGPVSRAEFDLPESGAIYVCPQSLFKFHPDFDAVLKDLLEKDPKGWLVLISDAEPEPWRKLLDRRFETSLSGVQERVLFVAGMPEKKYLRLLSVSDVMIDIPQFSGGNSTLEAFAMGTPVVTWPDGFMRGRVTAGYYRQMGMDDLIVDNKQDYVEMALKVAHDSAFKRQMQEKISANRHKVFEQIGIVRQLEQFFKKAFDASC